MIWGNKVLKSTLTNSILNYTGVNAKGWYGMNNSAGMLPTGIHTCPRKLLNKLSGDIFSLFNHLELP